jgi:hypothetical protein
MGDSNQDPSFDGNCVQQNPTLHSSPPSKQEYVKSVIPTFQEVERDIILRNAQLKAPLRQEKLQTNIQAYLLSVVKKIMPYWSIRVFSPFGCTLLPSAHNTSLDHDGHTFSFSLISWSCTYSPPHPYTMHILPLHPIP